MITLKQLCADSFLFFSLVKLLAVTGQHADTTYLQLHIHLEDIVLTRFQPCLFPEQIFNVQSHKHADTEHVSKIFADEERKL